MAAWPERNFEENRSGSQVYINQAAERKLLHMHKTEGDYSFDFTRFDQISDLFWNIKGMDYLETGFLAKRGPLGFTDPLIAWVDVNIKNAETGQQLRMRADSIIPYVKSSYKAIYEG